MDWKMGSCFQRTSLNKIMVLCLKTLSLSNTWWLYDYEQGFPYIEEFSAMFILTKLTIRTILVSDVNQGNALYRDPARSIWRSNMISKSITVWREWSCHDKIPNGRRLQSLITTEWWRNFVYYYPTTQRRYVT